MKKYSFSLPEKALIFSALQKNNVKLEYETEEDLNNVLQELYPIVFNSFKVNYTKNNYHRIFYEHDVNLQKISTYSKFFKYYDVVFFDKNFLKYHEKLSIALLFNQMPGMDSSEWFSIAYDINHNIQRYTFSTYVPLHDLHEDGIQECFSLIKYEENLWQYKFRKKSEYCVLSRVVCNFNFQISEIGYSVHPNLFYEQAIQNKYSNYKYFYELIQDKINSVNFVDVFFKQNDEKYISVEYGVDNIDHIHYLFNLNLIDETARDYILNNKKSKTSKFFTVKICWINSNNVQVKWYNGDLNG